MAKHDDWLRFVSLPVAAIAVAGNVQAAQYLTIEQAQGLMFGKSAQFERNDIEFSDAALSAIYKASGVKVERTKHPLWKVKEGE